jgi:hydroxyacylglutathione hydrolase
LPVTLLPGISIVGSGRLGLSLTSDYDCTIVLISGTTDSVLIDAGCGLATEEVLAQIKASFVPPVSRILITHAHADHAAGAKNLAEALGAEVWASAPVAQILESGDEEAAGLSAAISEGTYPPEVTLQRTPVKGHLRPAAMIDAGGLDVEAIETPGHAWGHLSFLVHHPQGRVLCSGDAVFARGRVVVLPTPESDVPALAASIELMAELEPDVLIPGHGEPVLRGAADHVRIARDAFRNNKLPPSLLT